MGQGSDTAMAQMVGEVLNMAAETIRIVPRDTDVTPYDMGTLGSRSLFHMGHAVRLAAEDAKAKIAALAREVGEPEGSNTPLADLFVKKYGMRAGNIVGTGSYKPDYTPPDPATGQTPNATPFWMAAGAGVEIEIDTETGRLRVLRLINVADVGNPINPKIVETQLSGAATMQLGFTLYEKMHIDGGQITNASLADYKIPGIHDIPPMENEAVEAYQSQRPVRRQGRRRARHLRRVAGHRQRHRRRHWRAAHRTTADARKRSSARSAPKTASRWRAHDPEKWEPVFG